jgi:16S rRNA (guanine966-N2)-methyltransferase
MIALLCGAQGYALAPNSGKDTGKTKGLPRGRRKALTAAQEKAAKPVSELRIIGGSWRSRRIRFVAAPEVRPTPDRIRETLFNWLQGAVPGARALDLFAGSGALGLEALSRGAAEVTFVERDRQVAECLRQALAELGAQGGRVVAADAFEFLQGPPVPYDLVFLDPPFAKGWLGDLCKLLDDRGWLAPHAWIYLECAARDGVPALPPGWTEWRHARAGEVSAHLVRRAATPA